MPLVADGNLPCALAQPLWAVLGGLLGSACVAPGGASPTGQTPQVVSPPDGGRFVPGQPLLVCSRGHGDRPLAIVSDVDGVVREAHRTGQGCPEGTRDTAILLSDAVHTLTVFPATGNPGSSASLTVVPTPNATPGCAIAAPGSDDWYWETEPVSLEAVVADDSPVRTLSLFWRSDQDGELAEPTAARSGWVAVDVPPLSSGVHQLTLSLTDRRGSTASCTTNLVVAPCTDADADGTPDCAGDCNDEDGSVAPGLPEQENGVDDDCDGLVDEDTPASDDDGDGHTERDGDCDDTDPSVHPGADDAFYDGIDSDCAGDDDFDADGDGARSDAHGGSDCDDNNAAVFIGAAELRDGLDNDCDTYCDEGLLHAGDLVITEIMANPLAVSDSTGEWFEVANTTTTRITLCSGWTGTDDRFDRFTVSTDVAIDPGTPAVFVRSGDPLVNGGVVGDYTFGRSFQIAETDDQITLTFDDPVLGAFEVSRVAFDGAPAWPDTEGATLSLDPAAWTEDDNDNPDNWCEGASAFGDGDLGTPGAVNDGC